MSDALLALDGWQTGYPDGYRSRPLHLRLSPGRVVALVGENGVGKSTLLRTLIGMQPALGGTCRIFGEVRHTDPNDMRWKQEVAFVADRPLLVDALSGRNNVRLLSAYYPGWSADACARLLARCPLPLGLKAAHFSTGQRMALALILAISCRPRLYLLDEPTSGLDPLVRTVLLEELTARAVEDDATVLLSTHMLSDVGRFADEVCLMKKGDILTHGDRESLCDGWAAVTLDRDADHLTDLPGVVSVPGPRQIVTRRLEQTRAALQARRVGLHATRLLNLEDVIRQMLED